MFDTDGSVIPNTYLRDYRITLAPTLKHTKVRRAEITISAPSRDAARRYAETWLRQGVLRQMTVETIEELT